jgi:DNA ligase (NAD+)
MTKIQNTASLSPVAWHDAYRNIPQSEWESLPGIGVRVAESLFLWGADQASKDLVRKLEKNRVTFIGIREKTWDQRFAGQTFVLTGELDSFTREEATAIIKDNGGTVSSSVSKSTNFVLAGDKPGSKLIKAQEQGVTILSEVDFIKKIQ